MFKPSTRQLRLKPFDFSSLSAVLPVFSLLFLVFYSTFVVLYNFIHNFYPPVDASQILQPYREFLDRDGIETPFMFSAFLVYVVAAYQAIKLGRMFAFRFSQPLALVSLVPVLAVLLETRSTMLVPLHNVPATITLICSVLFVVVIAYLVANSRNAYRRYVSISLWLILALWLFSSLDSPSLSDYGYFIAPALKIVQGEHLGTFYMQYNLLGTYLFVAMLGLRFDVLDIQLTMAALFFAWFIFYYRLICVLVEDPFLRFCFMLALVIVRLVANIGDPTASPQVLPFRLDLWVPLFLVLHRFGVVSPVTMAAFGIAYVLDDIFGLFYLAVYLPFLAAEVFQIARRGNAASLPLKDLAIGSAVVAGCIGLHFYCFHSFAAPAASLYRNLQIGFMPISTHSVFWILLALLPYCLYLFHEEDFQERRTECLFLVGLAAVELVYFYGRSHENNLLNISGLLLLLIFLGIGQLERLFGYKKLAGGLATGFVVVAAVAFGGQILWKLQLSAKHLIRGPLFEARQVDDIMNHSPDFASFYPPGQKIFVVSYSDAYYNYQHRLPQVGYMVPFNAHVYQAELRGFLVGLFKQGYKVVLWEEDGERHSMLWIAQRHGIYDIMFADNKAKTERAFVIVGRGKFAELEYAKRADLAQP
jgi:hypothetical protein